MKSSGLAISPPPHLLTCSPAHQTRGDEKMWKQQLRGSVEWALMVALIFGAGAIAQAQEEKAQAEGRIVQIGPADGQRATTEEAASVEATDSPVPEQAAQPLVKKYWIGLLGGPVTPELRYQLDIPEDQGVMVRDVVPESPAAEAGLKSFDIVLAAKDKPVHDMRGPGGVVGVG